MRALLALCLLALLLSNVIWYRTYRKLDYTYYKLVRDNMQTEGMLDWSNDLLKGCRK